MSFCRHYHYCIVGASEPHTFHRFLMWECVSKYRLAREIMALKKEWDCEYFKMCVVQCDLPLETRILNHHCSLHFADLTKSKISLHLMTDFVLELYYATLKRGENPTE